MNQDAMAIIILCSHLGTAKAKPFEPAEWTKMADILMEANLTPASILSLSSQDLINFFPKDSERIEVLLERSGSISFEISKYADRGINIVTRADKEYPPLLKKNLKKACPPLFYYAGDLSLCTQPAIGFVGSRNIEEEDIIFTKNIVRKVKDYSLVSGGAKGIDTIAVESALENGSCAIEYISDSLVKKIQKRDTIEAIQKKQLVLLSLAKPDAGFNTGFAMARNKFIYANSIATIVVRSDTKGGTWTGANEALKKDFLVLCRECSHSGNIALIEKGAHAIDHNWDCFFAYEKKPQEKKSSSKKGQKKAPNQQLSLFDAL